MTNELSRTLRQMLADTNKSLNEVACHGRVDQSYLRCLVNGEKIHPSPETLVKIYIGLVFCRQLMDDQPTMVHGLAELLEAAALTAATR